MALVELEPGGFPMLGQRFLRHSHLFDHYLNEQGHLILVVRSKGNVVQSISDFLVGVVATYNGNGNVGGGFRVLETVMHMGFPSLVLPFYRQSILSVMHDTTTSRLISLLADAADDLARNHGVGSIHGMITPGKILLDEQGKAFINGYIFFDIFMLQNPETAPLRPDFMTEAPEILRADALERTVEADVYRFGMTIYTVLGGITGPKPTRLNYAVLLRQHIDGVLSLVFPPNMPEGVIQLILEATSPTPEARPTMAAIASRLRSIEEG